MDVPIGHRVRAWRHRFGRNQTDCAAAMGVQVSGLSRIENGIQRVTGEQLEQFARFLGITMVEFYGDLPTETPSTAANG